MRFLATYRAQVAALTDERQPEIDALSRKLARQEQAIAKFVECHGEAAAMDEQIWRCRREVATGRRGR